MWLSCLCVVVEGRGVCLGGVRESCVGSGVITEYSSVARVSCRPDRHARRPDDAIERAAGMPWPPRRVAHLLAAFLVVVVLLLATLATGARFGPAWLVVRDAAGLLGLTALGAAAIGTALAWFLPLGWTLAAILFPQSEPVGQILTWQAQSPESTAAAVTAGLLALGGLVAYAAAGPAPRAPAEAAQQ